MNKIKDHSTASRKKILFFGIIVLVLIGSLFFWLQKRQQQMELKAQFDEQKNMLRDQLDDLIDEHDELLDEYGDLNNQLQDKDSIIQNQITEIRNLIRTKEDLTEARKKIAVLQEIAKRYLYNIDSLLVINKYLMRELIDMGLWTDALKNNIIANRGSVQHLTNLSEHMRNKYKTVWEMPMKDLIDMSADRAAFICQSQSLNLWMEEPSYGPLTSMHFYAWSKGLKTGLYYLRRKPKHQAQQFTIEPEQQDQTKYKNDKEGEFEICTMCSS